MIFLGVRRITSNVLPQSVIMEGCPRTEESMVVIMDYYRVAAQALFFYFVKPVWYWYEYYRSDVFALWLKFLQETEMWNEP